MFKKEIKFIYDFNLNEIKKLGNYITYEQLLSANLHPAILQYISADIDYLIFEDRQKILRNSIFDYSSEKVHQYFSLIGEEIRRTKRFSIDYMSKLILHASSFTVNYVSRPRWALSKFIYDDEKHKNTTEIKQILNYLYYYGYLRRIVTSYINRKKVLSINEKELDELLVKIDLLSIESNVRSIVQGGLKSMADFFNIGDTTGKATVPLKAVELFLSEKELFAHLEKLKNAFGEEDKRIGLIDCLKVLDGITYSKMDTAEESGQQIDFEKEVIKEIPYQPLEEETEQIVKEAQGIAEPESSDENELEVEESFTIIRKKEIVSDEIKETDVPVSNEPVPVETEKITSVEEKVIPEKEIQIQEPEPKKKGKKELLGDLFASAPIEDNNQDLLFDFEKETLVDENDNKRVTVDESEEKDNSEPEVNNQTVEINEPVELPANIVEDIPEEAVPTQTGKSNEQTNDNVEIPKLIHVEIETEESNAVPSFADNGDTIEISSILENKNLTKVIEVIFDYDIEDFALTIEKACKKKDAQDALTYLQEIFKNNHIDSSSKEAESLKAVITEFFNEKR